MLRAEEERVHEAKAAARVAREFGRAPWSRRLFGGGEKKTA
jgi:hypothetical protein